jgi:hypothetical protein
MTRRAGIREFHGCHQFPSRGGTALRECHPNDGDWSSAFSVADFGANIFRVGISCRPRTRRRSVAVTAIELNKRPSRAPPDLLHVNNVIEFDAAEIARAISDRSKLWMAVLKAANVRCVVRGAAIRAKIRMALRAGLIAGRGDIHAPPVLGMAFRASEFFSANYADGMMNWAVVAAKASAVGRFR